MSPAAAPEVLRHGPRARWGHGVNAAVVGALLITGYALADALPPAVLPWLGGHAFISEAHDALGLALAAVLMAIAVIGQRRVKAWLAQLLRLQRGDFAWVLAFAHDPLGRREPTPWHDARLDPLQRWVLALIVAMLAVVTVSGLCLYFTPPGWRWVFIVAVRAHIYANALLLAALLVHVLAGSGVLPTHRGIVHSMFGNGAVPLSTARRLWPGWTQRLQTQAREPVAAAPSDRAA